MLVLGDPTADNAFFILPIENFEVEVLVIYSYICYGRVVYVTVCKYNMPIKLKNKKSD